jgi:hypothetical protein
LTAHPFNHLVRPSEHAASGRISGSAVLRILFLDWLLSKLDASQQNILLRTVLVALNFGAILGLALLMGAPFSRDLIVPAVLATLGASTGAQFVFTGVRTVVAGGAADSAQFPPGINTFGGLGLPAAPSTTTPEPGT